MDLWPHWIGCHNNDTFPPPASLCSHLVGGPCRNILLQEGVDQKVEMSMCGISQLLHSWRAVIVARIIRPLDVAIVHRYLAIVDKRRVLMVGVQDICLVNR